MILSEKQIEMYNNCIFLSEDTQLSSNLLKLKNDLKQSGFHKAFNEACKEVQKKFNPKIKTLGFQKFMDFEGWLTIIILLIPGKEGSYYDEEALGLDAEYALAKILNNNPSLKKFKFDGTTDTSGIIVEYK